MAKPPPPDLPPIPEKADPQKARQTAQQRAPKKGPRNASRPSLVSPDDVREAQLLLFSMGEYLDSDGIEDSDTRAAVKRFQKKAGLAADGILGGNTLEILRREPTVEPRLIDIRVVPGPIRSIGMTRRERMIAVTTDGQIVDYPVDGPAAEMKPTADINWPYRLDVSPINGDVAVASGVGTVHVLPGGGGEQIVTPLHKGVKVFWARYSPRGHLAASCGEAQLWLWEPGDREPRTLSFEANSTLR